MKKQSIKDLYLEFSLKNHAEGSRAPGSYVTAMDIIDDACHQNNFFLEHTIQYSLLQAFVHFFLQIINSKSLCRSCSTL